MKQQKEKPKKRKRKYMKKKSWMVMLPKDHLHCECQRMAWHFKIYQRSKEVTMFYLCQDNSLWNQM